jgi:hypothetical protein
MPPRFRTPQVMLRLRVPSRSLEQNAIHWTLFGRPGQVVPSCAGLGPGPRRPFPSGSHLPDELRNRLPCALRYGSN